MKHDIRLMRKLGDQKVGQTIIVILLKNNSHAGAYLA
jgi:hypothetical protein